MSDRLDIGASQALNEQAEKLAKQWGSQPLSPDFSTLVGGAPALVDPLEQIMAYRALGYTSAEIRERVGNANPGVSQSPVAAERIENGRKIYDAGARGVTLGKSWY